MKLETARIFDAFVADQPQTHVLVIGVGRYVHGEGENATVVAGGLGQLSSPPKSAAAVARWFVDEFKNSDHPLGTVTMLVSDQQPMVWESPQGDCELPEATLTNVRSCLSDWRDAFQSHPGNMLVLYFCGHGVSLGQKAAMLLSDFGNDDNAYEPAIDIVTLQGTLRNARPEKQLFIIDCCRTKADSLYANEPGIGGRHLSIPPNLQPEGLVKQFVLFPSIDGQQAFGVKNEVSVFTRCFLDAVKFAGFDDATGQWVSSTALILNAIENLVKCRLPQEKLARTSPNALNANSFEFNVIEEPQMARSLVTIDPDAAWPTAVFTASCVTNTGLAPRTAASSTDDTYRCCVFEVEYGKWEFSGAPATKSPNIISAQRTVYRPVAYITLGVVP
jgi:hypothetical protein